MYKGKFASELSMSEVKEYYDEFRQKCPRSAEMCADFNILKERLIVFAYKILDGKTNGDVIKAVFPNMDFYDAKFPSVKITISDGNGHRFGNLDSDWWNAPYRREE